MKVKGKLVFTSEELEDIQRKAEKDNKFNASNPYEYVSYGVTAVLVYGVMSIFMPNVYLQARWLRIMMYTMEMFAALMLNVPAGSRTASPRCHPHIALQKIRRVF